MQRHTFPAKFPVIVMAARIPCKTMNCKWAFDALLVWCWCLADETTIVDCCCWIISCWWLLLNNLCLLLWVFQVQSHKTKYDVPIEPTLFLPNSAAAPFDFYALKSLQVMSWISKWLSKKFCVRPKSTHHTHTCAHKHPQKSMKCSHNEHHCTGNITHNSSRAR